ncbi:MAG: AzlD domain-containing protein [Lachnospiraceae bacterium]|jgi:branched-subunit amino acid transport protein AzlD|nr:AzlD domain-containing protein [Lachnospiraceae bacterium]
MIDIAHSLAIIAVVSITTFALRAAPFVIFGSKKKLSSGFTHLSTCLPPAIMATLVFYCLRNIDWYIGGKWLPEIICALLVVILHSWRKNILLSVAVGTISYMLMVQWLFA